MPAALVMQGFVDLGRMGCSSLARALAAHSADSHQSEDTLSHSEPLTDAISIKIPNCQRTYNDNYNVTPYATMALRGLKAA